MKVQKLETLYNEYKQNLGDIKIDSVNINTKLVKGYGSLNAKVVMVGEAPGAKEEELSKPFVGQAGKNLDYFLEKVGLVREDLYITNVVKYRPFRINKKTGRKNNRTPNTKEINYFKPYLYKEIQIIEPQFIVTLGNTALNGIISNKLSIGEVHGKLMKINLEDKKYLLVPLYHPASIIYRRELADIYELDLLKTKDYIERGENFEHFNCK